MDGKVKQALRQYINCSKDVEIVIVWKAKIIQNWKYLLIIDNPQSNNYYEVTYNGDKNELYIDVYKQVTKRVIENFN